MFSASRQKKYFNKRWKLLQDHLLRFASSHDAEELHRLRVEIKKINALIGLTADVTGKKEIKRHFEPVKKIFDRAGKIRSATINLQLSKKYKITNRIFKNKQKSIINDESKKFLDSYGNYAKILKKAEQNMQNDFADLKKNSVLKFFKEQLKKINHLLGSDKNGEKLHKARKKIKILLYLHGAISKKPADKLKINTNYLDDLQEKIGYWHDTVSVLEFLEAKKQKLNKSTIPDLKKQISRQHRIVILISTGFYKKVIS